MIYYPDSNFYQMVFIYPDDIIMIWISISNNDETKKQVLSIDYIEQIYFYKYPILTFLNLHLMRDLMKNKYEHLERYMLQLNKDVYVT